MAYAVPFITKAPCRVARVLEEDMCPPFQTLHVIDDYPYYYDPLYFPELHPTLFDNAQRFCDWLVSALNNHHLLCHRCPMYGNVCVFYDGVSFVISCNARSITMSMQLFESAAYYHCIVFSKIAELNVYVVAALIRMCRPCWHSKNEFALKDSLRGCSSITYFHHKT